MRKILNPHQKALVALDAIKGIKTFAELSSTHQVHASQISQWKQVVETGAHVLLSTKSQTKEEQRIAALERLIGQRDLEIEWLKKKFPRTDAERKSIAH